MSHGTDFLPSREADFLTWSNNFSTLINADPTIYGLDVGQAAAYNSLNSTFASLYQTAADPSTRTPSIIQAKRDALQAVRAEARNLARLIQVFPGTTNQMRVDLGLTVPDDQPSPIPPPDAAPDLSILATIGRLVKIRLRDQDAPDSRGRPHGVQGATVLYHVGDDAPTDPSQWVFANNTSRTLVDVEIPPSVPAGTRVWLTAFWFNSRKQSGPAALPEFTRVSDGVTKMAA